MSDEIVFIPDLDLELAVGVDVDVVFVPEEEE